jgi:hypothetical protein
MNGSVEPPSTTSRGHRPGRRWHGVGSTGIRKPIVALSRDSEHPPVTELTAQPAAVLLGMIPTLRFVTPAGLHQLAEATSRRHTTIGDDVVRQNDPSDNVFFIISGSFEVMISHFGQAPDFIRELKPGESFGELGVLYDVPRTATVRCTTPGEILCIPGAAFLDALDDVR